MEVDVTDLSHFVSALERNVVIKTVVQVNGVFAGDSVLFAPNITRDYRQAETWDQCACRAMWTFLSKLNRIFRNEA